MKNKRYSDAQIMYCPAGDVYIAERGILKQAECGVPVSELYRVTLFKLSW